MSTNYSQIILRPVVTEKSMKGQEASKYTVMVQKNANKVAIKQAIEKLYGVKVDSVNKIKVPQKQRFVGRGRLANKRGSGTKVIVSLKKGQSIDFTKTKESNK